MPESHVLTIVIPALNEEEAIGSTVERTLAARDHIVESSGVDEVEIVVVSDGSTDRTEEIAKQFADVSVLVFEKNRGYGAAIKTGFEHGRGDLVAFLDADGTCDPRFFADLCRAIDEGPADVALGSRMGEDSEMPLIRTVGNTIFAWILGVLSQKKVGDTASGMRVIRRAALEDLYPLPDGLHFTPAMSARLLMEDKLRLAELPMQYSERMGRSKLSVVKDGLRFLSCIIQAAIAYRPARPLLLVGGVLGLAAVALAASPVAMYLGDGRIEEWMVYRLLLSSLLATLTGVTVCGAVVADRIAAVAHRREPATVGPTGWVTGLFNRRNRNVLSISLLSVAVLISGPGVLQYLGSGQVDMHWSRAALSSLLVVLVGIFGITTFLVHMMELIETHQRKVAKPLPPDRVHSVRASAATS